MFDTGKKPAEILLVEDHPGDIRLIQEAFKLGKIHKHIHVAPNGVEALAFLNKQEQYAHVPTPDLILLDLNMPKKDGRQVLIEIKSTPGLKQIPVVILTTSAAAKDITMAYKNHANCYITKPGNLDDFLAAVQQIEQFWLGVVQLP